MTGAAHGRWGGVPRYALLTLLMAALALPITGGARERVWGIATAWAIQVAAVWPLGRALAAGRNATRPWLRGIALRVGGLTVTGGLAFAGRATSDLPVSYGISMVVLLLVEAAWLAGGLGRRKPRAEDRPTMTRTESARPDEPGSR